MGKRRLDEGLDAVRMSEDRVLRMYPTTTTSIVMGEDGLETVERVAYTFTDHGLLTELEEDDGTHRDGDGLPERGLGRHPIKDVPVKWRGRARDYGLAHRRFLQSTEYQRAVIQIVQGIQSLPWAIQRAEGLPEEVEEAAESQAEAVERSFWELEGGWRRFLGEAVYSLAVPGWGLWVRVHYPDGRLRKLAYRRSHTLVGLIYDQDDVTLLAVELETSTGVKYVVDVRDCLIISYLPLGDDFEAFSPWRSGCEWEAASQMLVERYMLSAEKHGTPQDIVEAQPGYAPTKADAETVAKALDYRSGGDPESIILPPGLTAKTLSPSGMMPPFLDFIRYAGEQKVMTLSAEGALFTGGTGHGSYAALDLKDKQGGRVVVHFAEIIADAINGTSNTSWSGVLRTVVDYAFGGSIAGRYPQLTFIVEDEDTPIEVLLQAIQAGAVELTYEVREILHRRLQLPPPSRDEDAPVDGVEPMMPAGAVEDVAKTALNGAQVASMVEIIQAVSLGQLPLDSAVQIIMQAFQMTMDEAMRLVGPAATFQPRDEVQLGECGCAHRLELAESFVPPKGVQEAAQRGLDLRRKYGRGGTPTGIARARDLANGRAVSEETIGRMVNFFGRHEENKDTPPEEGNGMIAWLLWGGDPGKRWAERIHKQLMEQAEVLAFADDDQLGLFAKRSVTPEEAEKMHSAANAKIGALFDAIGREMRREWTQQTQGGVAGMALAELRERFRQQYLPRFREAAMVPIQQLRQKGGLSVAYEMGLVDKIPKAPAAPTITPDVVEIADALAVKSYNITENYLLERQRLENNGLPEASFPAIPSSAVYAQHAASIGGAALALGRQAFVDELVQASALRTPSGKPPKIIAEYSSVLEASTCDPCAALDGRRYFVGSAGYNAAKPPSVCEGGNRCRCIFSYLADEADFAEIYEELESGFSQSGNEVVFSEGVGFGEWYASAQEADL